MKIIQYKNGSGYFQFTWKERITLLLKGKLVMTDFALRHFGNAWINLILNWQHNFNEEIQKIETTTDTEIELK
jgi:hypothetical protein